MSAYMYAGITGNTLFRIPDHLASAHLQSPGRTLLYTLSASYAGMDCLGVVAEQTVERAGLKKDGAPVSRAVYI